MHIWLVRWPARVCECFRYTRPLLPGGLHPTSRPSSLTAEREGERNVLFNDALDTFYLQLYGIGHMVKDHSDSEKERNVLFNGALNTFYLWLCGVRHMVKDHSDSEKEREREMFYLTMHSTHFIYGYMASDIWLRTILIVRKETCCCHIGYS